MKGYRGSREIRLSASMKPIHFYVIALMYALTLTDQQLASMGYNPNPNQPIVDQMITGHVELTTSFFSVPIVGLRSTGDGFFLNSVCSANVTAPGASRTGVAM